MSKRAKTKDIVVEVSEGEYRADLARGLKEDEVLKPGSHRFRRGGFLTRHGLKSNRPPAPAKVRISINLDLDVLNHFKERAAKPNAAPYQTQINCTLREVMEREKEGELAPLMPQAKALLADRRFIEAVAKRVKARSTASRKGGHRAA